MLTRKIIKIKRKIGTREGKTASTLNSLDSHPDIEISVDMIKVRGVYLKDLVKGEF